MAHRKRKDLATIRRRVEDGSDEEGGLDIDHLDDDSFSEESIQEDENEYLEDNLSQKSELAAPSLSKPKESFGQDFIEQRKSSNVRVSKKPINAFIKSASNGNSDLDMMLNGISLPDEIKVAEGVHFDELSKDDEAQDLPAIVKSTVKMNQFSESLHERRRREHEEYRRKRQEDPAFVPNRGAFFMHDHRHSGPAANGFRPFSRGRGRGRIGHGASHAYHNSSTHPPEPSDSPWTHDMHEMISKPSHDDIEQRSSQSYSKINSRVTINASKADPTSRQLSTIKPLSIYQIRVAFPTIKSPITIPGVSIKEYTGLPDHRPPLRRDKPVRISIPHNSVRYVYPAVERSFLFIPRAMRPNQQGFGTRGRGRSVFGSGGGYSRRTSVFGGSIYGSGHTPSVALSRRSSLAQEFNREILPSPTGSTTSKPLVGIDTSKPVVRLPPSVHDSSAPAQDKPLPIQDQHPQGDKEMKAKDQDCLSSTAKSENDPQLSQPNEFSKSTPDNGQKNAFTPKSESVSFVNADASLSLRFNPPQQRQQPFHQQVPTQVNGSNYSHETLLHSRSISHLSQTSTGTPLSQIPERAIHAQPFHPNPYQQQQFYIQPYPVLPQTHGYYCPPTYNSTVPLPDGVSSYIPLQSQQSQSLPLTNTNQPENPQSQTGIQNLIAQEVNGTIYYYDAAQIPAVVTYPTYQQQLSYPMSQASSLVSGTMNPSAGQFYYTQTPTGLMYHPQ